MRLLIQHLDSYLKRTTLVFSLSICSSLSYANEVVSMPTEPMTVPTEVPQLLTPAEIQQGLQNMQKKMNTRIEQWGAQLTRADFDRRRGNLILKPAKQLEVCQIFQGVIDETYQSAQKNKHRLSLNDQKVLDNRTQFISALGIKNSVIPTKLGFDCRVK